MVSAPSFLFSSAGDSIFKTSGFHKPWHLRILSFFESWKAINSFWMWTTFSECGWNFNFQCPALEISSPHLRVLALNNSYLGEVTNFLLLCVLYISRILFFNFKSCTNCSLCLTFVASRQCLTFVARRCLTFVFPQAVFDCPFGYQLTGGKASLWCTPTGTWSVTHIKHMFNFESNNLHLSPCACSFEFRLCKVKPF